MHFMLYSIQLGRKVRTHFHVAEVIQHISSFYEVWTFHWFCLHWKMHSFGSFLGLYEQMLTCGISCFTDPLVLLSWATTEFQELGVRFCKPCVCMSNASLVLPLLDDFLSKIPCCAFIKDMHHFQFEDNESSKRKASTQILWKIC